VLHYGGSSTQLVARGVGAGYMESPLMGQPKNTWEMHK